MTENTKDAVFDALKSRNFKVADVGDILGKSRQSVYNYVSAYVDPSQGNVPAFLHRLFSMCMSTEIPQEEIDVFWREYTKNISNIQKEIEVAEINLEKWDDRLKKLEDHKLKELDGITDPVQIKNMIMRERDYLKARDKNLTVNLNKERSELLNRPMSDFDPDVSAKVGRLSGPAWQGNDVETVCVANSGNYMIIVNPDSNPGAVETKLKLFTTVNDAQVHLKTMDFEKGSNMIQFSLIPQLVYRYEVIQITEHEVKSSGVLDLKNYI